MKKIKFGGTDLLGRKTQDNYPTDDNYMLLSYFVDDTKYNVSEVIPDLESVQKEEKTFEEVMDNTIWSFGEGSGEFICDKDMAYFKSYNPNQFQDVEIPLKELIDILYEWKAFLGK